MPFGLPNPKDIMAQLQDGMNQLMTRLDAILAELQKIEAKLGPPTPPTT